MKTITTDVAVIGAGSAGLNAFRAAENAGAKALLIESGAYGTTCARVGCMPSKLLIAAADVAHSAQTSDQFGIKVSDRITINTREVMKRVQSERDRFVGFVVQDTLNLPVEQRLNGKATFAGRNSLIVDDNVEVSFSSAVVATGGESFIPPPFDRYKEQISTNDDVFNWKNLPQSVAVIGTGIIGLELGQALARLGVRVSLFSPFESIGPATDPAIRQQTSKLLMAELDFHINTTVTSVDFSKGAWTLSYQNSAGQNRSAEFEKILVAAGRRARLGALNLAAAGIELDKRGQLDWDPATTQISDSPIFLAGDASGHRPLLHEAADEGRISGENAARYPDIARHRRRTPLAIQFTDPQIAMVGRTYAELGSNEAEIGEASFDDQGRARVMGRNAGLIRIYGDRTHCALIGAELIGPDAEHLAHLIAWAVQSQMTVQRALQMPFYHPVIEEALRTALRELATKLKVVGECRSEDFATAPGT